MSTVVVVEQCNIDHDRSYGMKFWPQWTFHTPTLTAIKISYYNFNRNRYCITRFRPQLTLHITTSTTVDTYTTSTMVDIACYDLDRSCRNKDLIAVEVKVWNVDRGWSREVQYRPQFLKCYGLNFLDLIGSVRPNILVSIIDCNWQCIHQLRPHSKFWYHNFNRGLHYISRLWLRSKLHTQLS